MAIPNYSLYDTATLVQVIPSLFRPQNFLLDTFFPNIVTSDSEYIAIDVEIGDRRLAPFVSPYVEGHVMESLGYATKTYKPAYLKPKHAPDVRKPVKRMIGERIGGEGDGPTRWAANIAACMEEQINSIDRRMEWMAASALSFGTVTVTGDGFPTEIVDFTRDASLTVTKTGGAKWTKANIAAGTAMPVSDVEVIQRNILKISGARVDKLVFTTSSWNAFIQDPILKGVTFFPTLAPFGNQINIGSEIAPGAIYKGRWGSFDLYLFNDWYLSPTTATLTPMLVDGTVLVGGPDLMGTRAFGMILDPHFNYSSMEYAPRSWMSDDPAQFFIMTQSAPLVIPSRVNATAAIVACDPVYT